MSIYESGEDYLEEILIQTKKRGYARSIDIAASLNVSKPSVSVAMKKLQDDGYIFFDEEKQISLTDSGREIAERIYERHVTLADFLKKLGVPDDVADQDACKIEHLISEESYEAICAEMNKLI